MSNIQNIGTVRELLGTLRTLAQNSLSPSKRAPIESIISTVLILLDDSTPQTEQPSHVAKTESQSSNGPYDRSWTIARKFAYLLKREQRFLHLREVADLITEEEHLTTEQRKDLPVKISQAIAPLKKDLVKFQIGKQNLGTFWGKKEWMSGVDPLPQHWPNEHYARRGPANDNLLDF